MTVSAQREADIRRTWAAWLQSPQLDWDWYKNPVLVLPTDPGSVIVAMGRGRDFNLPNFDEMNCHFVRSHRRVTFAASPMGPWIDGVVTKIECEGVILEHVFASDDGEVAGVLTKMGAG
jgi:hypothetical protein